MLRLVLLAMVMTSVKAAGTEDRSTLGLEITWGYRSAQAKPFWVKVSGSDVVVADAKLVQAEATDNLEGGIARTVAGAGDVDGLSCLLRFEPRAIETTTNVHRIWRYLLEHTDSGAAQRLQTDPAFRPDSRRLTVQLNEAGTLGFSLTVDQLFRQKAFWFPEFDIFVSAGEPPVSFAAHQQALAPLRGRRVLERVAREAEATYQQFTACWEDMGNPAYHNPDAVAPGHSIGLTWDSALYKFGVDRVATVRNDYGKLDPLKLAFDFGEPTPGLEKAWKQQRLSDGLPVVTTIFEKEGVRCEVEQFAFPLAGPPAERRGDIPMVLFQKMRLSELTGHVQRVSLRLIHERELLAGTDSVRTRSQAENLLLEDSAGQTLLAISGAGGTPSEYDGLINTNTANGKATCTNRLEFAVVLAPLGAQELIVKLPSPAVAKVNLHRLLGLDYAACRATTCEFWNNYLAQGAQFSAPEEAVNALFRANLWHALSLPRRHGGTGPDVKIDLPYSNFAYDQNGTPWPVNQAVYVDYMLYDLRGYHALSAEELEVVYRNNQEPDGHVGGFANWGVYTPGMLYAVAQHYLLSGDASSFEHLLPATLHALDWCLAELKRADRPDSAPGLMLAPLNDLSHEPRAWAFNEAYFVRGLDRFGRALARRGHPRAAECAAAAASLRAAIEREFGRASVRSPAVQLADGTWVAFVPCDAQGNGRSFRVWYPTEVDTGPLHLPRLEALNPQGQLTTAILEDHEDNLLLHQWGAINEPVYNMQGTVYLLRDNPKAAIRTFYSTMACAFSHSVFEPVEHRWSWGQYFGPPSTDGSWFELYRHMLIQERDDDSLLLGQAIPRAWLEDGKRIEVRRAPTYFGPLSFAIESRAGAGQLIATVDLARREQPGGLFVRFRHPQAKPMRSALVNGQDWKNLDAEKEWVCIPRPAQTRFTIIAQY
jgi:hypothetical protein